MHERSAGHRKAFAGLLLDAFDMEQACAWLAARTSDNHFGYVVTPNVDHVVKIDRDPDLLILYRSAALCLCDSRILSRLARFFGVGLPVVPGSDLVKRLFDRILQAGDTVCIVGGDSEAAARMATLYPKINILHCAAPMGLRDDPDMRRATALAAANLRCRFILLAVGCPQQESIAFEMQRNGDARGTALCIGASIDFLVDRQRRAPRWMQTLGFEWAWRLAGDPVRLARRYLWDGPRILPIVVRTRRSRQ